MLAPEMLGKRLRVARKQLGWTLAQVAARSGVSITTISRAERGQLALGYENVAALGQALQLDMGALFACDGEVQAPFAGPIVTRAGEGVSYRGLSFTYEFLATAATGKPINPVLGTIHARQVNGPEDFARHAGVEFVYVLSGEIEVHFENGDVARLAKGDSLYFESMIGHAYISVSRQLARIIGVITAESNLMTNARHGQEVLDGASELL
ncbi:helix-turn-helix domain-containing protein [Kerstersia similis]|uniref:helix-turn-helix domain-containing protein n=1 Tax=Kerstersia similis TaxID=206505 RepID=UPI0039EFA26C